jgi:hypothetical protein
MLSFLHSPSIGFSALRETHAPHNGPWGDQPLWQNGSDPRILISKRDLVSKIDPEREHEIFHQPCGSLCSITIGGVITTPKQMDARLGATQFPQRSLPCLATRGRSRRKFPA